MDNKKVGELIAYLRKKKGLTQEKLGELVGITSTSVSKWERGINTPDKGILNDLCQILDTSLDELLTGEIKEEIVSETTSINEIEGTLENNETEETVEIKNSKYKLKKILLISIPVIIIIAVIFLIYNNNKTYAYNLLSTNNEYYVEGKVIFRGKEISIVVSKIKIKDEGLNSTIIKNYEYEISSNNKFIIGFGYNPVTSNLEKEQSIKEFLTNFSINYNSQTNITKTKIAKNNIVITLKFIDKDNNEIIKDIEVLLYDIKDYEQIES